jgi:hypothetical protein
MKLYASYLFLNAFSTKPDMPAWISAIDHRWEPTEKCHFQLVSKRQEQESLELQVKLQIQIHQWTLQQDDDELWKKNGKHVYLSQNPP